MVGIHVTMMAVHPMVLETPPGACLFISISPFALQLTQKLRASPLMATHDSLVPLPCPHPCPRCRVCQLNQSRGSLHHLHVLCRFFLAFRLYEASAATWTESLVSSELSGSLSGRHFGGYCAAILISNPTNVRVLNELMYTFIYHQIAWLLSQTCFI